MNSDTAQLVDETGLDGAFVRQRSCFTDRVSADGSTGFPARPGRHDRGVTPTGP